jgi:micrococcal nuclease
MTVPPNVLYVDYFRVYQAEARASGHGLWGLDSEEKIASPDKIVESEYIGNRNSRVFHRPSCDGAVTMSAKNRLPLQSREQAIEEGFKPCLICKP